MAATGGWGSWQEVKIDFDTQVAGVSTLVIEGASGSGIANFDWLELAEASCTGPGCGTCDPSCSGSRICGDDGCGGSCGTCQQGSTCNSSGQCDLNSSCSDGIQNQGETGPDCGGPCAACPPPGGTANLFANADFASGLTGWSTYVQNGEDSIVAESGGARFFSDPPVNTNWHMQLYQSKAVLNGDSYTFSVDLQTTSTSNGRSITIQIEQNGGDYTVYGSKTCTVPAQGAINCALTATTTESVSAKFVIFGAEEEWDFIVDNAVLVKN
jgi:hypothetical protein